MKKILVVDDIKVNRTLLVRMLALQGYDVLEAADGEQSVELFRDQEPDLVLMDVNMPGLNGLQAASQIKAINNGVYTPIIFVTANSEEESLSEALAAGGDDFVSKPVNFAVLESKIRAHLRIQMLNRQLEEKNRELVKHNQYLAREQELVEYFFENALKQSFLDPGCIKYHLSGVSAFNGDVLLAERGPEGGLYVVMGDFTGHGLSAAMGTLPVAQVFFKMARNGLHIKDIARELNHYLVTLMPASMFFTATLLQIDPAGRNLSVWCGGSPDAFWLGTDGELKGTIRSQHMPLGILQDDDFEDTIQTLGIKHGDTVCLYTDGVIEASNENGEMFGGARLEELLRRPVDDRIACVLEELERFQGGKGQQDDITLVEIACQAVPAASL